MSKVKVQSSKPECRVKGAAAGKVQPAREASREAAPKPFIAPAHSLSSVSAPVSAGFIAPESLPGLPKPEQTSVQNAPSMWPAANAASFGCGGLGVAANSHWTAGAPSWPCHWPPSGTGGGLLGLAQQSRTITQTDTTELNNCDWHQQQEQHQRQLKETLTYSGIAASTPCMAIEFTYSYSIYSLHYGITLNVAPAASIADVGSDAALLPATSTNAHPYSLSALLSPPSTRMWWRRKYGACTVLYEYCRV